MEQWVDSAQDKNHGNQWGLGFGAMHQVWLGTLLFMITMAGWLCWLAGNARLFP